MKEGGKSHKAKINIKSGTKNGSTSFGQKQFQRITFGRYKVLVDTAMTQ